MNHHLNHYLIGALALALGGAGLAAGLTRQPVLQLAHVAHVTARTWAPLSDDTQHLVAAVAAAHGLRGRSVSVFCNDPECRDLAEDMVASLESAGVTAQIEVSVVPLPRGIFLQGSPGDLAALKAIVLAAGLAGAAEGAGSPAIAIGRKS